MLRLAIAGAIALGLLLAALILFIAGINLGEALGKDNGEWKDSAPELRQWFKSIRSPSGIPCCDIADGHRAEWRNDGNGGYEVLIGGEWFTVPPEAVVRNAGNPVGEAIVWYVQAPLGGEIPRIRCFVAGNEG